MKQPWPGDFGKAAWIVENELSNDVRASTVQVILPKPAVGKERPERSDWAIITKEQNAGLIFLPVEVRKVFKDLNDLLRISPGFGNIALLQKFVSTKGHKNSADGFTYLP